MIVESHVRSQCQINTRQTNSSITSQLTKGSVSVRLYIMEETSHLIESIQGLTIDFAKGDKLNPHASYIRETIPTSWYQEQSD